MSQRQDSADDGQATIPPLPG